MATPPKVLQIGVGRWGRNHAKTWRALGVDLRLCDVAPRALDDAAPLAAIRATRFEDLLGDADLVDVVTPAPTHAGIVRACLAAGKDVLCEKPLALSADEAYGLAEDAEAAGRILQVGHIFRFDPRVEAIRRIVRSGRIGRVRYARFHFLGFKRPRADGGVTISDAIHMLDLASFIFEKQPRKVTAVLRDYFGRGLDDAAFMTLDFGFEVAHIEAGYFPPERKRDLAIMGEHGSIACDFLAPEGAPAIRVYGHAHARRGDEWVAEDGPAEEIAVPAAEPLERELAAFLRAAETREAPLADGFAGAHAVAAIEAAERSSREERAVAPEIRLPAYAG